MGYWDNFTTPTGGTDIKTTPKVGNYFDSIVVGTPQSKKIAQLKQEASIAQEEARKANSFGGLAKETLKGVGGIGVNFAKNLWATYEQTPDKIIEDIKAGATDIETGHPIKGILKTGLRTAGDAANAIFAPIGAAIGAVLEASGGQKLTDKAGEIIADESGITNWPAFQKFAMSHPNAGEDFNRILNLVMSKGEKSKIEPARILTETKNLANKLVSHGKIEAKPIVPEGNYFDNIQVPSIAETAYQNTIKNGGVTISLEGNQPIKGIAYAPDKKTQFALPKNEMTPEIVDTYKQKWYTALSQPGNHLGMWEEDGKIYLDVSKVGESIPQTFEEAMKGQQLAVHDLSTHQDIQLGKIDNGVYTRLYDQATNHPYFNKGQDIQTNIRGTQEQSREIQQVKVPGEQLPVGTGELKVSRLEARITDKLGKVTPQQAKDAGMTTYQQMNKKENIAQAAKFVSESPDEALAVLKGEKPAPAGLTHGAIGIAAEANAELTGSADLISKLASLRATRYGQEISILSEADPLSITNQTRQIQIAREEAVQKTLPKGVSPKKAKGEIVKKAKTEIKTARMKVADAQSLLDSLIC